MILVGRRRALLLIMAFLVVSGFSVFVRPAHATGPTWPVLLDANSSSSNDASPDASFTAVKTFNIGAIIEANSTTPLSGVFAWQFAIIYDNTTVVPQGDPVSGQTADGAGPGINFGSMTGTGQVNWAGRIAAMQGFGSSVLVDPKIDNHHNEIQVFFTILSPNPAVSIAPVASSTIKGNLLANVPFELIKPAAALSFTLDAANTKFVDSNTNTIPGIVTGPSAAEMITNNPPTASFTANHMPNGDPSCSAVTGSACSPFAVQFDASASSDSDGFICGPVGCTGSNAAGYFWDFGDGTQDNTNAVSTCPSSPPLLACNQGSVAIHDYSVPGIFTVTLRLVDNQGATGSARDILGGVIINIQPSHARQSITLVQPPLVVSVDCGTGQIAGKPFNCTVFATGGTTPYTGTGTFSRTEPTKGTRTETFSVTDANGVTASGSATVNVAAQPLVVAAFCPTSGVVASKPFDCTVSATGGTTPYTGTGTISRSEPTKGAKTESFVVTDSNGVSASGFASVTVTAQPLVVTVSCPTSGVTASKPFNCTVSATGGTAPYSGTGTFSRTESTKGTETESFTVADANAATASGSTSVSVAAQPMVATVSCPSTATAGVAFSCTVTAAGGTAPYTGTGTFSRTAPTKGSETESFTVTDANAASVSGSANVNVAAQPLTVTVLCPTIGVTIGKPFICTVSATGGSTPYSGTGTFIRTEASKGTKTESFAVTDANAATALGSTSVSVAAQPLVVTVSCPTSGVTAGKPFSCTVSATGGSSPLTGTGTFSRTEPAKGTKTESFTVTDANAASASGSASVSVLAQPLAVTVSCPTNATAGVAFNCTVTATGGTIPYTGIGTFSRTEPAKGSKTESFTVTDANAASASGSATVNVQGTALVVTVSCPTSGVTAGKPFSCTVSASGDTGPYTGTGTISRAEPTKGTKTESFTVTDANSVSASGSATVSVAPQPLVVTVSCPTSGVTSGKPFNCTVGASGGTTPYSGTGVFSRSEVAKGTKTESFTVTDANAASASGSASVSVAAQPLAVTVSCPTNATAGVAFNCAVSATGGTSPYTGTGMISRTEPAKGTKTESFTVTDANAASVSGSANVNVAAQPLTVTVLCPTIGVTIGKPFSCTVSATGGSTPYSGTGSFSRTENTKGTKTESFTVTDANAASASGSTSVSVAAQPLVVTVSCPTSGLTAGKPFNCTVTATGGSSPYIGTGDKTVTEATKGSFTESFTVADSNGVSASGSVPVTVVGQPLAVTVNCPSSGLTASKPFTCLVSASGGTGPYTGTGTKSVIQAVKGSFTESFTVTDANGASGSGFASVVIVAQPLVVSVSCPASVNSGAVFNCTVFAAGGTTPYLGTGTFTRTEPVKGFKVESFTVSDANGVVSSGSAIVSVVGLPPVVTVTCPASGVAAGKPFNCTVEATGGTSPYTGTGILSVIESTKGTRIESFTVTDANGLSASGSITVLVSGQPLVVAASCPTTGITSGKPFNCSVSATGGTGPYTGTGVVSRIEATKGTFTESFSVTDANGVSSSATASVTVAAQPLVVSILCPASAGAGESFSCSVLASGGTSPYSGTGTFTVTEPIKGAKSESFSVTDANGINASGSATVGVFGTPLIVTVTCPSSGVTAGKPFDCIVDASGDTGPYVGTGTISRTEPAKGLKTETFTVTDANGVTASGSATVTVAGQPLTVTTICPTSGVTVGKPFSCTVLATGGTGPYIGTGTFSVTETTKGAFTESFTVTDANAASASASASVSVAAQPLVVTVTCPLSNVTAGKPFNCTVSATGGTGPYIGTGTFIRTEASKGAKTESFTVTDANTASASGSASVSVLAQPLTVTVSCPTNATAGVAFNCTVTATGGTTPYAGTGTFSVTEATKGTKTESFTVIDANSASTSGTASSSVTAQLLIVTASCPTSGVTAGDPFNCIVSAVGGTAPYTGTGTISRIEPTKGTKIESFTVIDSNNATSLGASAVYVSPRALTASFTPSPTPTAGELVTFTGTASGGTTPYSFSWEFGDGTTGTGNPASHTYASNGETSFNITLTVVDSNGVQTGPVQQTMALSVPDFTISATTPMNFPSGSNGTSLVSVSAQNGFSSPIQLTAAPSDNGLTCTLAPDSLPTGSGHSTLSCSGSPGSYSVTVTASGGGKSHSYQIPITVTAISPPQSPTSSTILGVAPGLFYGSIVVIAAMVTAILTTRRRSRQNRTKPLPP